MSNSNLHRRTNAYTGDTLTQGGRREEEGQDEEQAGSPLSRDPVCRLC